MASRHLDRRTVARGVAWGIPAVAVGTSAPARAASMGYQCAPDPGAGSIITIGLGAIPLSFLGVTSLSCVMVAGGVVIDVHPITANLGCGFSGGTYLVDISAFPGPYSIQFTTSTSAVGDPSSGITNYTTSWPDGTTLDCDACTVNAALITSPQDIVFDPADMLCINSGQAGTFSINCSK